MDEHFSATERMTPEERCKAFLAWVEEKRARCLKIKGYEMEQTGGGCTALVKYVGKEKRAIWFEFWITDGNMEAPKEWRETLSGFNTEPEDGVTIGCYDCNEDGFIHDSGIASTFVNSEEDLRKFERECATRFHFEDLL